MQDVWIKTLSTGCDTNLWQKYRKRNLPERCDRTLVVLVRSLNCITAVSGWKIDLHLKIKTVAFSQCDVCILFENTRALGVVWKIFFFIGIILLKKHICRVTASSLILIKAHKSSTTLGWKKIPRMLGKHSLSLPTTCLRMTLSLLPSLWSPVGSEFWICTLMHSLPHKMQMKDGTVGFMSSSGVRNTPASSLPG